MNIWILSLRDIKVNQCVIRGNKSSYESNKFDSNKVSALLSISGIQNYGLQLVFTNPSLGGWIEVKNKKGKKVKLRTMFLIIL